MLVSSNLDKRAKRYTRSKIRAEIVIGNNRGKTLEKEKLTNRLTNERSLFDFVASFDLILFAKRSS